MIAFTALLALSGGALASRLIQERQVEIPDNWN
jgi:hypothetical protein